MFNNIAIPKNLQDFCKARVEVNKWINEAQDCINHATEAVKGILPYDLPYTASLKESPKRIMQEVDIRLWQRAFDLTGYAQIMDAQAQREFHNTLKTNPPEFNENNIRSIFLSAAQESEAMFKRGIVNVFKYLSNEYKANSKDPFVIGEKCIMRGMFSGWIGYLTLHYGRAADQINDIDRVFKTLDGKQHHPRELETKINEAVKAGNDYEDDYFKIKAFKNGNMHLWFKRRDLLDKVNTIIAEWYGDHALADGTNSM